MKLSLYVGESRDLRRCVDAIVDAERRGPHGVWLPATRRVVRALLDHGRAALDGSHYAVDTRLWIERRPAVALIVGTLGERICRAAGQFADAIMTWLAPASYVSSVVLPAARAGAEAARRPAPRVIATLSRDRRAVLADLDAAFAMMARAPSYLAMLERAGLEQPADDAGWTDEPLDAVVAWGDEAGLHARAQELLAAGAEEVVFWPFPAGDDRGRSLDATLDAMQQISATEGALR